ncbi:hypothetical protein [Fibrobacter intestinalis]|uniref:hypothetical protein n=1 Tax=Fibrobacter TaxID=832 RepID=UPI0011798CB9|nr:MULTISPECIES: hypothetical protein [Fibrobacter]
MLDNILNEYNFYSHHNGLYRSITAGYSDTPEITFRNYDTKAAQFNQEKLLSIIDLAYSYGVNVVGVIFRNPRAIFQTGRGGVTDHPSKTPKSC